MDRFNCEVIEDILPLYVEDMESPSTKALVEEHLADCEKCRKKEQDMRKNVQIPIDTDTGTLEKIRRYLFRKKVTTVIVAVLSVLLIVVLLGVHLNSPIVIPYEEVAESVKIEAGQDGRVTISMDNKGGSSESEYEIIENGDRVQYISIYTTRWKQFTNMTAGSSSFEIETTGENAVSRVFYYPSKENGESVCLYETEDISGGVVVLPRLTLNYYTLIAVLLTFVGAVACFFLRKEKGRLLVALKVTLFPLIYAVSSVVVLSGKGDVYNAGYYFTGILMVTVVLYIIGYWMVEYFRYRGGSKGKVKCS